MRSHALPTFTSLRGRTDTDVIRSVGISTRRRMAPMTAIPDNSMTIRFGSLITSIGIRPAYGTDGSRGAGAQRFSGGSQVVLTAFTYGRGMLSPPMRGRR